ncbi:MAG: hypothetical protein IJ523_06695 [Succinivibrionaceae bacterium]|nr:hypothetical protein [Succinivibrionaceae bacterium]
MATREIKTRFKLEGEQEYKRAMTDAANAIKVLNSEEKLAKAQFEATGDAQQYAADQARILKEQIENQKRAVKAAEDALADLTKNGVDKNSKQVQTWRTKLNNAKTALYNMQTRLDKVGTELGEEEQAFGKTDEAGQAMQSTMEEVAKGVNLQNVINAIDGITSKIEAVVKAAAKAAKAVWEMGVDASTWADGIATAANQAGVDPETYQSWMYASKFIDTSVDDIVRSWKDIDNKLAQEGDAFYEYAGSMAKAGIAIMDTSGNMRQGKDIFWDTIDYLHNIADEGTRSAEAMRLFGNDWRKLNPLITAGSAAYKEMAEQGMSVAVVSNKDVEAMGQMNDNIEDLGSRFDKLKFDTLAALAPTFNEVAQAMSTAITALDEFVQSEEGQAALKELNEALSGVISSFLGDDNGKGTFASIVDTAKTAVENFTSAMDWISQNGEVVKGIIEGIAIAWAGLKATKEILLFMQLLKATPLSKLQTLFNGGGNGTTPTTPTPVASGAGAAGKTAASAVGTSAAADFALYGVGVPAAVVAAAVTPAVIADNQLRKEVTENLEAIREEATEAAEEIGEAGDAALQVVNESADALGVSTEKINIFGQGVLADTEAIEKALDTAAALNDAAEDNPFLSGKTALKLQRQQAVGASGGAEEELLYQIMQEAAESLANPKTQQAASDIGETISDAMDEIMEVQEALDESTTPESIESMYGLIDKLVENKDILDSLSQGTKDLLGAYFDEESGFGAGSATQYSDAQEVLDAIFSDLDAAWDRYVAGGKNMPEGYAQGIQEGAGEASSAAGDMAQGAVDAAEATLDSHSPSRVFEAIGGNVAAGLANGIYARGNEAINAARWLAQSVTNIVQSALQIHSPSKVFERLGSFTGLGFAEGIEGSADAVNRAVGVMLGATTRQPALTVGGVAMEGGSAAAARRGSAGTAVGADTVHVTLVLDEEVLGDVMAPIVNDKIGAKINATRR